MKITEQFKTNKRANWWQAVPIVLLAAAVVLLPSVSEWLRIWSNRNFSAASFLWDMGRSLLLGGGTVLLAVCAVRRPSHIKLVAFCVMAVLLLLHAVLVYHTSGLLFVNYKAVRYFGESAYVVAGYAVCMLACKKALGGGCDGMDVLASFLFAIGCAALYILPLGVLILLIKNRR